ncbi:hypothetical protein CROQUDRAFT_53026 [Cronartium quercuum f. sp. fusiforme G11]|uniref:Peptidase A1 domain-containing protein n=1 Tax=Cronartium quercuum f. sp. fusiforme G11 TaxID=708437 RepID=A0A9P6NAB5_9BASI|nr:hypothetical protein CROQUDRAFT_53026 [Cronartium quercuum f. sp. fusiforme G11]
MSHTVVPTVFNATRTASHATGAAAYAKAARRYGFETKTFAATTKGLVLAIKADGTKHQVPAESLQHDLEYVVPVTVGTPGIQLMLDFDTGSSDMWVWSSILKAGQSTASGHNVYDPAKSSTSKKIHGSSWHISYGDGSSASGVVYEDDIKIGDLTCEKQGVEVADKLSSSFLNSQGSDGLLGLAWPQINTAKPQQKTPMQNFMEKNITEKGVFTACLRHDKEGKGFYSFGTVLAGEAGVKEESIEYTPIDNSKGFWEFPSEKAVIGSQTVDLKSNTAIADTGTTLALVADEVVDALYKAIPGAKLDNQMGGYVFPENAKVPDVQIAVADKMYTIYGKDLGYGEPTNGMVFGGIQSRGNNPFDILGDTFLKSVYVVFDQKNVQIGFAQRKSSKSG